MVSTSHAPFLALLKLTLLPTLVLQIQELIERIYAIPDGMSLAANKRPNRVRLLVIHYQSVQEIELID